MTPQPQNLETEAARLVNTANNIIEASFEGGKKLAPEVMSELIRYEIYANMFMLTACLSVFVALILFIVYLRRTFNNTEDLNIQETCRGLSFASWVASIVISLIIIGLSLQLLKLCVAPKIYILEYAAQIVK